MSNYPLGAPALTNVNPTAHQAEVRDRIVKEILTDYALSGRPAGEQFRHEVDGAMQDLKPVLKIPSASDMQRASSILAQRPARPSHPPGHSGEMPLGADKAGAMDQISKINKNIAAEKRGIGDDQRALDNVAETHR